MLGEEVLKVEGLSKWVAMADESISILQEVNLSILRNETVAILGVSGSGKSTLLGLLAGLDTPTEGEITLLGEKISHMSENDKALLRRHAVGFVFQNFELVHYLTALENVMLPLDINQKSNAIEKASELLGKLGLGHRLHHYPNRLSGGEQQRVAIARAFINHPSVIFLDEPTGNLDRKTSKKILDLIFTMQQDNQTSLLIVTHDLHLAERCHRCYEIVDGCLKEKTNAIA